MAGGGRHTLSNPADPSLLLPCSRISHSGNLGGAAAKLTWLRHLTAGSEVRLHPEDCLIDSLALEILRSFRGCFWRSVATKCDTAIVGEMARAS